MKQIRSIFWGATLVLILTSAGTAWGRADPMRPVLNQIVRPEIVIVFDTSSSMNLSPTGTNYDYASGSDCLGSQPNLEICGDKICSGQETSTCADCANIYRTFSNPGSALVCRGSKTASRSAILKRVLRNLLPSLRGSANFGLITFQQTGYFQYFQATYGSSQKTTVLLTDVELMDISGWDTTNDAPQATFTWTPINESVSWTGVQLQLLSTAGLGAPGVNDSLYRRADNYSVEKRFPWATARRNYHESATGYDWEFVGSYYTYNMLRPGTTVRISSTYNGPQFTGSLGGLSGTWIHRQSIADNGQNWDQGYSFVDAGLVLENVDPSQTQPAQNKKMAKIVRFMNTVPNGGIFCFGNTPTGPAMNLAKNYYSARNSTDPAAPCRKRFVLVLSDGQSNVGSNPISVASDLYNLYPSNRIKTYAIGVPGLPTMTELDNIASAGGSTAAYFANNEAELTENIRNVLLEMINGDEVTSPSGTATSGTSTTSGDLALVSSAQLPQWYGNFRAFDLTGTSTAAIWNAADNLKRLDYRARKLYTGYPDSIGSGAPVPLFTSMLSTLYLNAADVNVSAVRNVWLAAGMDSSIATEANVRATVEWLAGRPTGTDPYPTKMGAIFRSTPAVVGPPPIYTVAGHSSFELTYAQRPRLAYITSNDGVLHAFRVTKTYDAVNKRGGGDEVFGYIPPNLWPNIYKLYRQGGQDSDLSNFTWVLANSARVEDVPPTGSVTDWRTVLVQTMGPGGEDFVSLDVTDPVNCTSEPCVLNSPPFRILSHSRDVSGLAAKIGQTWSVPALYYESQGSNLYWRSSMGSGYPASQGSYYVQFDDPYITPFDTGNESPVSRLTNIEYSILANTAVAVNYESGRELVAVYQADLNGRIFRYGNINHPDLIIGGASGGGASYPFYYAPAIYYKADGNLILAAASGSLEEEYPLPESKIYLRREYNGTVYTTQDNLTCAISNICSSSCFSESATSCLAPSNKAMPTASPLIIDNEATGLVEAYYTYYDPPSSSNPCGYGDSYVLRVSTMPSGAMKLVQTRKYTGVRISGLSIVGAGKDLAIVKSGRGSNSASVETLNNSLAGTATVPSTVRVESWREVR